MDLSFLDGYNVTFLMELYERYRRDPQSVDPEWAELFEEIGDDAQQLFTELQGPSWKREETETSVIGVSSFDTQTTPEQSSASSSGKKDTVSSEGLRKAALDSIRTLQLVRAYRVRGHLESQLDPLNLQEVKKHPELDPAFYGFSEADMDRSIYLGGVLGIEEAPLRTILQSVRECYCGKIGIEFLHIQDPDQKSWIQEKVEGGYNQTSLSPSVKRKIYEDLVKAEGFETFLDKKFTGTKRFGLDGGEATIPALEEIIKRGVELGLEEIVIGMAHRGRLNVLANIMEKPYRAILSEFQGGAKTPVGIEVAGDVKYHLGASSDRVIEGKKVHLSLTANPSHLEVVNPVVVGKVRAKQRQRKDLNKTRVMGMLLHGDAAFAGQGLVQETLDLSELKGYAVGGTVHVVINNQIGFTTNPVNSRPGPYCTDVAKAIQAPIFHVNGDDPEAVVLVARLAIEFRQRFKKDVVIDLICYRRFGHNEGDEPMFTQPKMYKRIKKHTPVRNLYAEELARTSILAPEEAEQEVKDFSSVMEQAFEDAKTYKEEKLDWFEGSWANLKRGDAQGPRRSDTRVAEETLRKIGQTLVTVPEGFSLNRKIARLFEAKKKMFETGEGFDWGTAEAMAFGSLLLEGQGLRFSGQDVERGTFSHRHAAVIDQETEEKHVMIEQLADHATQVEIVNSNLSEAGVLGFEYGYSMAEPQQLIIWEAQFGDFVNGAQLIIDQFISSAETKWLRMSGLVMLLPHGYEGQGPEHSSARPERFLQMCAEDNWQIANVTTPANYFHILRRQQKRDFRKPLVIFTPKSLLRHKACVSQLKDFYGDEFHRVLPEPNAPANPEAVKRVVLCSGKVYYDLLEAKIQKGSDDVALVRLEQLYPFPKDALHEILTPYKHAEIIWCQEEPQNMGYWTFVQPEIEAVLVGLEAAYTRPLYIGRKRAASPATGFAATHKAEQEQLVQEALDITQQSKPTSPSRSDDDDQGGLGLGDISPEYIEKRIEALSHRISGRPASQERQQKASETAPALGETSQEHEDSKDPQDKDGDGGSGLQGTRQSEVLDELIEKALKKVKDLFGRGQSFIGMLLGSHKRLP